MIRQVLDVPAKETPSTVLHTGCLNWFLKDGSLMTLLGSLVLGSNKMMVIIRYDVLPSPRTVCPNTVPQNCNDSVTDSSSLQ